MVGTQNTKPLELIYKKIFTIHFYAHFTLIFPCVALAKCSLVVGPHRPDVRRSVCNTFGVPSLCNPNIFIPLYSTLCTDFYILRICTSCFCAHFVNTIYFLILGGDDFDIFPSKILRWSRLCNLQLQQFSCLYIRTLHNDASHIENVPLLLCARLIIFVYNFGSVELRHSYVNTTFGTLTLLQL